MYKKVLKNLDSIKLKKVEYFNDLYKNINEKKNPILDRTSHFIFSAENPLSVSGRKVDLSHQDALNFLDIRGYTTETINGKYGTDEKSILVHNPPKHSIKHLFNLAKQLGQESSIYSDGYNHELHYHHGENAGQHVKGQGTGTYKKPPEDFYSEMQDGTIFSHRFNMDELHPSNHSMVKKIKETMQKSEGSSKVRVYLAKGENEHPLENASPDTNLIHYSKTSDLKELDPTYQGKGIKGSDFRAGKHKNPLTWFYMEGVRPESLVTEGASKKYVSKLGDKKTYDIGTDPDGIHSKLKEGAASRQVNPGIVDRDEYHDAIRNAGYHGIYNSRMSGMDKVVGMFEKMPIHDSHDMHQNDHKETTAFNHYSGKERLEGAKKFAEEMGHHDYNFLSKLGAKFNGKT